uniref:DUF4097 family beta strand repeat-containing protein n=1 Tax=Streptacidiphilus carbonis TaxID=105422 RepID=UPI0005A9B4B4
SERKDTVVEIHPSTAGNSDDLRAADETKVDFVDGKLTIRTPRPRGLRGPRGSVRVEVALPEGSSLNGTLELARLRADGPLGRCDVRVSAGDIQLDEALAVRLKTDHGNITLDRTTGNAVITTGSGEVRVGEIAGNADIKNSNGSTWIDDITGDLHLKVSNGNVTVARAQASVTSRTSNGSVRLGTVERGTHDLRTTAGNLHIGVLPGTPAWLDIDSQAGTAHSDLGTDRPASLDDRTVRIHARTTLGDITVEHAKTA